AGSRDRRRRFREASEEYARLHPAQPRIPPTRSAPGHSVESGSISSASILSTADGTTRKYLCGDVEAAERPRVYWCATTLKSLQRLSSAVVTFSRKPSKARFHSLHLRTCFGYPACRRKTRSTHKSSPPPRRHPGRPELLSTLH